MVETPSAASKRLTRRYITALLLVAATTTTGFLTLYFSIKKEEAAATVINVAGRQRMLSQRIALFINRLQDQPGELSLQTVTSNAINLFEKSHDGLVNGSAELNLPGLQQSITRDIYFGEIALNTRARQFIADARTALNQIQSKASIDEELLKRLNTDAAGPLLNALDTAVASFERESKKAIQNLETIEMTVFIFTLLLLLAEALIIFRPAVRRVYASMQQAVEAGEATRKSARERQLVLDAVSHELRTPLGQIMHAIASIPPEEQSPAVINHLNRIADGCDDITGTITAVMNFVSLETSMDVPRPRATELKSFLDKLTEELAPRARAKNLEIYHHPEEDLAQAGRFVKVDPEVLTSILTKLLKNAIQYTDEGRVIVTSRLSQMADDACELQIDVSDTGIGIPKAELETVFDAFEAAARSGQAARGLGLGLSQARAAAKQLGGTLTAQSLPGTGSTFTLKIPVELAEKPETAETRPAEEEVQSALDCLVAEDNPVNRIILANLLQRAGHKVTLVNNGQEAVSEAGRKQFDAILLDINMPEMKGDEACRSILENAVNTQPRMIAVTANTLPEQIADYHACGFHVVVAKPIQEEKLYGALAGVRPSAQLKEKP